MEPTSNPTQTDIHTAKPADNEVQALEYNEATIVFQGDHGYSLYSDDNKIESFQIFNIILVL